MESRPGTPLHIGIIGSGIGGSSAAYFVRRAFESDVEITVFERAPYVGGRIQEMEISGATVETGARFMHTTNRYLTGFVTLLGLHRRKSERTFGIWNGKSFDIKCLSFRWLTRAQILLRYGLTPLHIQGLVKNMADRLFRIYDLQDHGQWFETPEDMFRFLGLYDLTQQNGYDFFRSKGISNLFLL